MVTRLRVWRQKHIEMWNFRKNLDLLVLLIDDPLGTPGLTHWLSEGTWGYPYFGQLLLASTDIYYHDIHFADQGWLYVDISFTQGFPTKSVFL